MNKLYNMNLNLFDSNINTTAKMSDEMKEFYVKMMIELAGPNLVHEQFGQKTNIPLHAGEKAEWRKLNTLPAITTKLTEGVTPAGQSLAITTVKATVGQYGAYVTTTDRLNMSAIDPLQVKSMKALAAQAGKSRDTIVRDVISAGTNVVYGGDAIARSGLNYTSADDNDNLTVDVVRKAVRTLERQDAPKIDGYYVAIIHPDCKYDLMSDPAWRNPHEYVDTDHIYKGEIGELYGVRFVQSSNAIIFPKAGAASADVYGTLIFGEDAYGVTEIGNGGIEYIAKGLGEGEDPLNQRSTQGWKTNLTAQILVPQYIVRVETTATPAK